MGRAARRGVASCDLGARIAHCGNRVPVVPASTGDQSVEAGGAPRSAGPTVVARGRWHVKRDGEDRRRTCSRCPRGASGCRGYSPCNPGVAENDVLMRFGSRGLQGLQRLVTVRTPCSTLFSSINQIRLQKTHIPSTRAGKNQKSQIPLFLFFLPPGVTMLLCIVVTRGRKRPKVQVEATVSRLQTRVTRFLRIR